MDFWERLDAAIDARGTSRKAIAQDLDFTVGNFASWKSRQNYPTADVVVKIARALGVSVEYLVTGSDASDPWLREHADFLRDCKLLEEAAAERFGVLERSARAEAEAVRDEEKKSGEDSAS